MYNATNMQNPLTIITVFILHNFRFHIAYTEV